MGIKISPTPVHRHAKYQVDETEHRENVFFREKHHLLIPTFKRLKPTTRKRSRHQKIESSSIFVDLFVKLSSREIWALCDFVTRTGKLFTCSWRFLSFDRSVENSPKEICFCWIFSLDWRFSRSSFSARFRNRSNSNWKICFSASNFPEEKKKIFPRRKTKRKTNVAVRRATTLNWNSPLKVDRTSTKFLWIVVLFRRFAVRPSFCWTKLFDYAFSNIEQR